MSKSFNTLIVDASTENLYVAVLKGNSVFGGGRCDCQKRHSEVIISEIDSVLSQSGLGLTDIDAFACGVGCGSFTGLRVAISTVKGLNASLNKKLVAVNTLEIFAYNNVGKTDVLMDAGGGKFFYAAYLDGDELESPRLIFFDEAEALRKFETCAEFNEKEDLFQRLVGVVQRKILRGEFVDDLKPLYLRKCQAEEQKEAGKI